MPRQFTEEEKRAVLSSVKHARRINASRRMARIVRHTDPTPAQKAQRTRLEKNLGSWLKFFLPEMFPDPWSADHDVLLEKTEIAIRVGGLFAIAMPRGQGKTTVTKGSGLFAAVTGLRHYIMSIAATDELAMAVLEFIQMQIEENDRLHEFYPHITTYARATEGKAIKARFQLREDGKPSGIAWGKNKLVFPNVVDKAGKPYPSNGVIVEARGLTGAIRGKNKDQRTGHVVRPDFVILDDPQTRESAESIAQCDQRERTIVGDVLGLAGPRRRIAAVMPCTIIRKGDLADRFLNRTIHPEWQGEVFPLVKRWPEAQDTLWAEYRDLYQTGVGAGRGIGEATAFYAEHRAAMDQGSVVSWEHRIRDGETSALQTAENLLLEFGGQFWAEFQNDPRDTENTLFRLTVERVAAQVLPIPLAGPKQGIPPRPRGTIPSATTVFCGHIDINRVGLHWALAGFDQEMTGHSPAYGKWPERSDLYAENSSERDRKEAIWTGLRNLCEQIRDTVFMREGIRTQPRLILIDRGFEPDVVQKFCAAAAFPFQLFPARGVAAQKYLPRKATLIGRPFQECHMARVITGDHLVFNSDFWRETMQRGFLSDPGQPGGFTLYNPSRIGEHLKIAEHIVAERLRTKYQTGDGMRWEWDHEFGADWDLGDALTGCWVAAAATGMTVGGPRQPMAIAAPLAPPRENVTMIEI